jgi:diguanylate cyclase (GGDEF)-like protein
MRGDEFTVFFEYAPSADDLDQLCRTMIESVSLPISFKHHTCKIGVSIGCALGHRQTENPASIFIKADRALYEAKSAGRNCYHVHMDRHAVA